VTPVPVRPELYSNSYRGSGDIDVGGSGDSDVSGSENKSTIIKMNYDKYE